MSTETVHDELRQREADLLRDTAFAKGEDVALQLVDARAEVARLCARVAELEAARQPREAQWGVRWPGIDEVEHEPGYTEAGMRSYIADMEPQRGVLVRRWLGADGSVGPWVEVTE